MRKTLKLLIVVMGLAIVSCQSQNKESEKDMNNPFFKEWTTPFGVPPFDEIKVEHFIPAVKEAIKQQENEFEAIVNNDQEPDFENTILAMDKSGRLLDKVTGTFFPLNSANTSEEMQSVAREMSPLLTQHNDNIMMNPKLFERVKAVYENRNQMNLDKEQLRVTEKYYQDFERNGANLSA
ncbi:MAG: peptidase M3, partial [Tangfeifania sp.]